MKFESLNVKIQGNKLLVETKIFTPQKITIQSGIPWLLNDVSSVEEKLEDAKRDDDWTEEDNIFFELISNDSRKFLYDSGTWTFSIDESYVNRDFILGDFEMPDVNPDDNGFLTWQNIVVAINSTCTSENYSSFEEEDLEDGFFGNYSYDITINPMKKHIDFSCTGT